MFDTYDQLLEASNKHGEEIELLSKRVNDIETNYDSQETRKLRQELIDISQYSIRQNIEIHGLPVTDAEKLLAKGKSCKEAWFTPN